MALADHPPDMLHSASCKTLDSPRFSGTEAAPAWRTGSRSSCASLGVFASAETGPELVNRPRGIRHMTQILAFTLLTVVSRIRFGCRFGKIHTSSYMQGDSATEMGWLENQQCS